MPNNQLDDTIVMWGPVNAGKSFMLQAFARELQILNEDIRSKLIYQLFRRIDLGAGQIRKEPVPIDEHFPPRTPQGQVLQTSYLFKRLPRDSRAPEINNQEHVIDAYDLPGGDIQEFVENPQAHPLLKDLFLKSKNIIATFDVAAVRFGGTAHDLDGRAFAYLFEQFIDFILNEGASYDGKRNIALCITKSDTLGFETKPEILLRTLFSNKINALLEQYREDRNLPIAMKAFLTSAVGFLRDSSGVGRVPNINSRGDALERGGRDWIPYYVSKPFFWIFGRVERERLGLSDNNDRRWWDIWSRDRGYYDYP